MDTFWQTDSNRQTLSKTQSQISIEIGEEKIQQRDIKGIVRREGIEKEIAYKVRKGQRVKEGRDIQIERKRMKREIVE